jgi:hypothetical protein
LLTFAFSAGALTILPGALGRKPLLASRPDQLIFVPMRLEPVLALAALLVGCSDL